ncbi:hypothetical protein JCM10207_004766 [Rhodosporidiobolus poonsookiae]
MSFSGLPTETLEHIFEEVIRDVRLEGWDEASSDLVALSEVCRAWRPAAQKLLWRTVSLDGSNARMKAFLRASRVGRPVKRLVLYPSDCEAELDEERRSDLEHYATRVAYGDVNLDENVPPDDEEYEAHKAKATDTWDVDLVLAVFAACPDLELFRLEVDLQKKGVLALAPDILSLYFPRLRTLWTSFAYRGPALSALPASLSTIEVKSTQAGVLSEALVRDYTHGMMPGLTSLTFHNVRGYATLQSLARALTCATLPPYATHGLGSAPPHIKICFQGFLRKTTRLTSLSIGPWYEHQIHDIPSTVEHLTLDFSTSPTRNLPIVLRDSLGDWAHLVNLRSVHIRDTIFDSMNPMAPLRPFDEFFEEIRPVRKYCEDKGIRFSYEKR